MSDDSDECTPERCAAQLAGCTMHNDDSQPMVIASLANLPLCDPHSPYKPPPPPPPSPPPPTHPPPPSPSAVPPWAISLIVALLAMLLGACVFVLLIRHRERKGNVRAAAIWAPASLNATPNMHLT